MIDNIKWIEKRLWLPQPITASEDFVHALSEDEYLQVLHNLPAHVVWDLSDMFFRSDFPRFMQNGGRGEEFLKVALVRNVLADMMRAVNLDQKVKQ